MKHDHRRLGELTPHPNELGAHIMLVLALLVCGCTVPDDDNWSTLERGVSTLPKPDFYQALRWAANREMVEWLGGFDGDDTLFTAICKDGAVESKYKYTVGDVIGCLDRHSGADTEGGTYLWCLHHLLEQATSRFAGEGYVGGDCDMVLEPDFHEEGQPDEPLIPREALVEYQSPRTIAEDLVKAPRIPFWLLGVITVGVGGVLVLGSGGAAAAFLPALCTLSAGGPACPSNPNYPVGSTPQPDKGGGT